MVSNLPVATQQVKDRACFKVGNLTPKSVVSDDSVQPSKCHCLKR